MGLCANKFSMFYDFLIKKALLTPHLAKVSFAMWGVARAFLFNAGLLTPHLAK